MRDNADLVQVQVVRQVLRRSRTAKVCPNLPRTIFQGRGKNRVNKKNRKEDFVLNCGWVRVKSSGGWGIMMF